MNELRALGAFLLRMDGRTMPPLATQKARALLAYLVAHRDRTTARETLVDLFWPDADPDRARKSLNTALWSIRKCLREGGVDPDALLHAGKLSVRWVGPIAYDVEAFEQERSPELYHGEFLEGDYEEWTLTERERLASMYEASLQHTIESGDDVDAARLLLARDPYSVRAYEVLIANELKLGRSEAARTLVERARKSLSEIDPALAKALEARFLPQIASGSPQRHLTLPFAGRRSLLEAFAHLRPPYPVVMVHGIPGSGKSTLLEQIVRDARSRGVETASIDVSEQDVRVFGPWERLYEQRTGEAFSQFIAGAGESTTIALASRLAGTFTPGALLVVDNVQFLSGDGLEVFVRLAKALLARDVAVIAACRSQAVARLREEFGSSVLLEWEVGPLSRNDLRGALAGVAGLESEDLADALFTRSEGHALFAARLLEFFVERGIVSFDGARWRYRADERAAAELPANVRRFIEARLRACGQDSVLVAAVLSLDGDADADQIVAVCGLPESAVYDALDDLLAHGFIVAPDRGPQFAFAHDLIRETAQTLVAPQRRAALHRRFSEVLADVQERGTAIRRARHLVAARRYAQSVPLFEAAAMEALEWHANAQAEAIARAALDALAHLAEGQTRELGMNLFKRILSFVALLRQSPQAVWFATEALAHAVRAGDRRAEMFSYSSRAQAYGVITHEFEKMLADVDAMEGIARESESRTGVSLARVLRAYASFAVGDVKRALEESQAGYDAGMETGNWQAAVTAMENQARYYASVLAFDAAYAALGRARGAAEKIGRLAQGLTHEYAAFVLSLAERLPESIAAAREAFVQAAEVAHEAVQATRLFTPPDQLQFWACASLVDGLLNAGDQEGAASELRVLLRLPHAQQNAQTRAVCAMLRARIEPARELLEPLSGAPRIYDTWFYARQPAAQRALLLAQAGDPAARADLQAAFEDLRRSTRSIPADADRVLGEIAAAAERLGARELAAQAQALSAELRERRLACARNAPAVL